MPRKARFGPGLGAALFVALAGACGGTTTTTTTTATGATWNTQTLPPHVDALNGVSCPTASNCWSVGTNSSGGGGVVASTDGGGTWRSQTLAGEIAGAPAGTKVVSFGGVSCPTASDCFAVGATTSNTGAVAITVNGGKSWTIQAVPNGIDDVPSGLFALKSVSCPTPSNCWAVGATSSNIGTVVATTDGGRSWKSQDLPSGISLLNGVSCPTASDCFVVGATSSNAGAAVRTTDGGNSWTTQSLPGGIPQAQPSGLYALNGLSCPTPSNCWAVGVSSSNAGIALGTTDGGSTWRSEELPSGVSLLNSVSCTTSKDCRAVGATSSKRESVVASTDGGATWKKQSLPGVVSLLYGVSCPTASECWAVGATSSNAGVVLNTTDL